MPPLFRLTAGLALSALLALPAHAAEITVFAAASLRNALDQVAADWTARTGDKVVTSYAGSSALARQIEQGAPADLFISASVDWMDALDKAGAIRPDSRRDLLGNTLVLIAHDPQARPVDLPDLPARLGAGPLAMAMVDSVPAGVYGKQALTHLGLWGAVSDRVAQADNVRAALALVALGEAPLGIVYATDARAEPRVHPVATFPADSHDPITYPAALTTGADPAATAFLEALSAPQARAVFEAQGFAVLTP